MTPEQKIEAEAEKRYPYPEYRNGGDYTEDEYKELHKYCCELIDYKRADYIAGRSAGLEREKEILNKYILDVASLQGGISLALDELDETHNGNLCKLLKGLLEIKPNQTLKQ